jgi:Raf kinase inhibitor-like YbhB/YbcL family protein
MESIIVLQVLQRGEVMEISSKAYKEQERIPDRYVMPGAGGENVSIPLSWTDPPKGTSSFALTFVDPHPVANDWMHWVVINIPAEVHTLEEGASGKNMPKGAVELTNSFGEKGYGGPQPPPNTGDHPYVATIYALSEPRIELEGKPSLSDFKEALRGKILENRSVTGLFSC